MPRIALLQLKSSNDPQLNIDSTKKAIIKAADGGAQIICTQELFTTEYFCIKQSAEAFQHAVEVPGELTHQLGELASELGVVIIASLFEKRTKGIYHNTAVVLNADGSLLGKYRQQHISQDATSEQKFYFTQGEEGYLVADTMFGKIGVLISWDQWFTEAARINALKGADIIVYPTTEGCHIDNISDDGDVQHDTWKTILRSHAISNCCYVAAVNRVGIEDCMEYWGRSLVADPAGTIIAEGAETENSIVFADIDLEAINSRRCSMPIFRDRRIDTYKRIIERTIEEASDTSSI